jgi:hypothetical protein
MQLNEYKIKRYTQCQNVVELNQNAAYEIPLQLRQKGE